MLSSEKQPRKFTQKRAFRKLDFSGLNYAFCSGVTGVSAQISGQMAIPRNTKTESRPKTKYLSAKLGFHCRKRGARLHKSTRIAKTRKCTQNQAGSAPGFALGCE
jgi:hypothetical protein